MDTYKNSKLWESRRTETQLAINPKHHDYPNILAEALDIIFAFDFEMNEAANKLQISATQLLKIVAHENSALTWLNTERTELGLSTLKT